MRLLTVVFFILIASMPWSARATELGLGLTAIEEGDDRIRPGILGHIGYLDQYATRIVYYGRKFGPVTERTLIISAYRYLDIFRMFKIDFLAAGVGLAVMNEQIVIDVPGDSDKEDNPNIGFTFGLHGVIPVPGPVFLRASMESHLFLAGAAGILLATGRKNVISLTSGVQF